ncbi:MAG TPA: hypothetical protein VF815_45615 [Myxococcaceae bacterium]
MGKAFSNELTALADTLAWAQACDVSMLERFVADVANLPLVAIGSGGSSTACHLAALLHRARHQRPSFHTTPLDILSVTAGLHRAGTFLASASGKNKDVLAAFDACVTEESPAVAAVTLRADNPLTERARLYGRARVFASDLPTGKDGFLATNSLVATCVLIARAYGFELKVPTAHSGSNNDAVFRNRHMVQVLFGGWAAPVATDLESKLNESALAAAQLADYRNFGHGRHLWLAKRAPETVLIALVTPGTSALAAATLKLFPKSIPIVRLETKFEGPSGTIDLLLKSFALVDGLGRERQQDPGRPHVPEFGRKLYRLAPPRVRPALKPAVQRKVWASPGDGSSHEAFKSAFDRFLARLSAARIGAVALDYDGTMCTKDGRFDGLRDGIVTECTRLLRAGLHLGIATGRGKSVRQELQAVLERKLWPLVHIGYYNGTDIGELADDFAPSANGPVDDVLVRAFELLSSDVWLKDFVNITPRPHQLTVEPKGAIQTDALASHVMSRIAPLDGKGVRLVCSTHSLDVLGARTGKGALVSRLREKIGSNLEVLCIGDRGAWPGNDYALLAEPLSLSVDEVSSLDDSCWNIAPRGVCGPDATVLYLRAIKARRAVGTFAWKEDTSE